MKAVPGFATLVQTGNGNAILSREQASCVPGTHEKSGRGCRLRHAGDLTTLENENDPGASQGAALQRRELVALVAAGLLPLAPAPPTGPAGPGVPLKALGAAKGLRVGNAIGMPTFADPRYRALMLRECDTMVTENECKWQIVAPSSPDMDFRDSDRLLAWGAQAGLMRRGHCLVWQPTKWLPKWVVDHDFGTRPALEAERLLMERIVGACRHYGEQIYSWDVVNEAVDPPTGEYRVNVLTQAMGAVDQLDLCFRLARESAPHAQLVYNDFMHWDAGSAKHRAGVLELLAALKSRGTPVDALGLQSHISAPAASAPSGDAEHLEWRKFLDEVSALGLQLLITEFDVNDRNLAADIATRDAGVAAVTRDYLDLTFSYPGLGDFLFWGLVDRESWLQKWPGLARHDKSEMRPAPFDDRYQPKPLREAVAAAIRAMPPRVRPRLEPTQRRGSAMKNPGAPFPRWPRPSRGRRVLLASMAGMALACATLAHAAPARTIVANETGEQGGFFYSFWTESPGTVSMSDSPRGRPR